MEDRFKFRGMDINGKWHVGFLSFLTVNSAHAKAGAYISNSVGIPLAYQVRPDTVGQCTGLKDKNGKLIWEGDVIKHNGVIEKIVWANGAFWSTHRPGNTDRGRAFCERGNSSDTPHDVEIIGNIYENPGLLENE